jgi:ATP-binding cassette, subfamily B, bacterial PglK
MLISIAQKLWYLLDRRERRQATVLIFLMMIGAVLEIVGIGAIPAFISTIVRPELLNKIPVISQLAQNLNLQSHQQIVMMLAALLGLLFAFKSIYLGWLAYLQNQFLFGKLRRFTVNLYRIYMKSPYIFHLDRNSSELIHYINNETYHMFVSLSMPFLIFMTEGIVILFVAILLAVLEPIGSLSALMMMIVVSGCYYFLVRRKMSYLGKERQFHAGKMVQWVNQGLSGIKEIKVAGKEDFFVDNFDRHCDGYTRSTKVAITLEVLPRLMLETIAVLVIMALIAIGFAQGKDSAAVLNSISLFAIASFRLLPAVNRAIGSLTSMRYNSSCLDVIYNDVRQLNRTNYPISDRPQELSKLLPQGQISLTEKLEFRNVSYTYPGSDRRSINNLSLKISQGQRIGLVGYSGAGKTTLVDLLLGLLSPTQGQILADGDDINDNIDSWREIVGYIPQSIYLCDDTIAANIAFGFHAREIDRIRVWAVIEAVQMGDFIRDLPEQLETMVGEGGVRLSGGQRQRIGIARALYRNPQLLVMDEATSALDNQTEQAVTQAIEQLSRNKTLVIIAHRLSTVQNCDIIYVMGEGKIIAEGTYSQLLAENPKFQQLALAKG